jgi:hypothetical protein
MACAASLALRLSAVPPCAGVRLDSDGIRFGRFLLGLHALAALARACVVHESGSVIVTAGALLLDWT